MISQKGFSGFIQVHVTCSSVEEARQIAHAALMQKLTACVQIEPAIESHFLWKNALESAIESRLTLKSSKKLFQDLCQLIKTLSSYETPEILATDIQDGCQDYLDWLEQSLRSDRVTL